MDNGVDALWRSMGIANLEWGQALMVLVGGLLIFLAIRKNFEPLLLLPIGFGCVLANAPVAGLAEDSIGQLILAGNPLHLRELADTLGVDVTEVKEAAKQASGAALHAAKMLAATLGYEPGMLNQFYAVAIGSGIAPLLIFMGVGALTDFSALIAKPSTVRYIFHANRCIGTQYVSRVRLYSSRCLCHRDYWRRRWAHCHLPGFKALT